MIEHLLKTGEREHVLMETDGALANATLWCDAWFSAEAQQPDFDSLIQTIATHFGGPVCADRLVTCYNELLASGVSRLDEKASGNVAKGILNAFVLPERFNLLRN